ncbi:replicase [Circovirus sp.]|nr:replicase [Circovirus sp.]
MGSRAWCFTLNNPCTNEPDFKSLDKVRYATWQLERGECGTPHLQGYVELDSPQRFSYFRTILGGAHFEQRRGTRKQAREYCTKEETREGGPWEYGVWQPEGQGNRTDLAAIKLELDAGVDEVTIASNYFGDWVRYGKRFRDYITLCQPVRAWVTEVQVYWGKPGTGKTWEATKQGPYFQMTSTQYPWWDGYNGADNVILDDFYGWIPFHGLLKLLDRYPATVQVKGGMINFAPRNIYITSNRQPDTWYKDENLDQRALMRRITSIREFTNLIKP